MKQLSVFINPLIIAAFAPFPLTGAFAKAGCCSGHGGVAGCQFCNGLPNV